MGFDNKDVVELKLDGNVVKIHKFGATVISWVVNNNELIFLSKESKMDGSKAIRGGIPVVFPQFAKVTPPNPAHTLPQHGFARVAYWKDEKVVEANDSASVIFTLNNEGLAAQKKDLAENWPFKFQLNYKITLTKTTLVTDMEVTNLEQSKGFPITPLLHTYFKVPAIEDVKVLGLKGLKYHDKVTKAPELQVENREALTINQEVDSIYVQAHNNEVKVNLGGSVKYEFSLEAKELPDAVVWNPWTDLAKGMSDMGDEEFHHFVCVELGRAIEPITVEAGSKHTYGQTIRYNEI